MHRRAGRVHGIEDDKVTRTVAVAFEANDSDGVTGLLEIDGR